MDRSDLASQRASIKAELSSTRKSIRDEKRARKDKAQRMASQWQLNSKAIKLCMTIYMLAEYRAAPAIRFLHVTGRKRKWPERSDEELQRLVEDSFMNQDVAELAAMCNVEGPQGTALTREAVQYVDDWRAAEYVRDLNARLGVAPSTADVLQKLESNRLQWPEAVRPSPKGTVGEAKARVWAQRFRRRYGGKHGRVRIVDDIPLEEMRSKASFLLAAGCGF
jgi:hypothetical protein